MKLQSIQLKIALLAGGCLLCAMILLSALSFFSAQRSQDLVVAQTGQEAQKIAEQLLQARTEAEASAVQSYLNEAFVRTQLLAQDIYFLQKYARENRQDAVALHCAAPC